MTELAFLISLLFDEDFVLPKEAIKKIKERVVELESRSPTQSRTVAPAPQVLLHDESMPPPPPPPSKRIVGGEVEYNGGTKGPRKW